MRRVNLHKVGVTETHVQPPDAPLPLHSLAFKRPHTPAHGTASALPLPQTSEKGQAAADPGAARWMPRLAETSPAEHRPSEECIRTAREARSEYTSKHSCLCDCTDEGSSCLDLILVTGFETQTPSYLGHAQHQLACAIQDTHADVCERQHGAQDFILARSGSLNLSCSPQVLVCLPVM